MTAGSTYPQELNFRHLVVLYQTLQTGSVELVAERIHLSKPAVYQAIKRLESVVGVRLFERHGGGELTEEGQVLAQRVGRALQHFAAFNRSSQQQGERRDVIRSLTDPQLRSLIEVVRHGSYAIAAVHLNLTESSVHRTARSLENLLNRELFVRKAKGVEATLEARQLARQASLAYAEIRQGLDEINQLTGQRGASLSIGCLPLARTDLLPESITLFLNNYPNTFVSLLDGPYDEQLNALLHGDIDFILGATRTSPPSDDVVQTVLFNDELGLVMRANHPALQLGDAEKHFGELNGYGWIAPRQGTPTRTIFSQLFTHFDVPEPEHLLECSSLVAIRGLLVRSDRIALLSKRQVRPEIEAGQLAVLDLSPEFSRPIGLTKRKGWHPTAVQQAFMDQLLTVVKRDY